MAGFVDDDEELSSIFPEGVERTWPSQNSKKRKVDSLRQAVFSASITPRFPDRFRENNRAVRPSNPVPVLNATSDGASVASPPTIGKRQNALNPLFNPFSSQRSTLFSSPEMVRPTPKRTREQEEKADDYLEAAFSRKASIVHDETSNESTSTQNSTKGGRRRRLRRTRRKRRSGGRSTRRRR